MRRVHRYGILFAALVAAAIPSGAAGSQPAVRIEERAKWAERVLVATVADTTARYERNEFGDDLIVTYARLAVEEVLKGPDGPVTLAIEGGTVNGITMRTSSLPIERGERAVFFLTPSRHGTSKSHLRGQGILKLESTNRVRGSSLTLDEIRRLARLAGQ